MIHLVVFDIGGVFFNQPPLVRSEVLTRYRITEEDLARLKHHPVYRTYKQGLLSRQGFLEQIGPVLPSTVEQPEELFRDLSFCRVLNEKLVEMTSSLRERYRVGVLSNSDSFLEERLQHFGIDHLFEFVVNSYRVQLRKPDPRIFLHLLEQTGMHPRHILFVDDKIANVQAARTLGLHGHVFRTVDALRTDMAAYGLLA